MEWLLALICMMPAAVSDLKYRNMSLESCVAALLVSVAAFIAWALAAPADEAATAAIMACSVSVIVWAARRMMGSGDWWFVAGACIAISTIGVSAVMVAIVVGLLPMAVCHVMMCVRRPGLPLPRRLVRRIKREGERFSVDPATGKVVPTAESGMVVFPGLPMVTFVVVGALATGVVLSL